MENSTCQYTMGTSLGAAHTPESMMEKLITASWGCVSRTPYNNSLSVADHETTPGIPILEMGTASGEGQSCSMEPRQC